MIPNRTGLSDAGSIKQTPAVFILSPPRSGSTLLRVMLAGHPRLFAPQELELLSFDTLQDRKASFTGRNSFWLEGTIRALMEIRGCDAEAARSMMESCENEQLTTEQFYRLMQEWLGERILVDKTPSYALDLEILKRAEAIFAHPIYIHLLRHPYGMVRSFEDAKLEQLYQVFFTAEHHFTGQELGELIWLISHQNILEFLNDVPANRQHRVSFEELVNQPKITIERICQFLGLDFHPDMLRPYKDQKSRMTDGIHTVSRMLGDVKFRAHADIDPNVAERWKGSYKDDFLGDVTWQIAERLGYKKENPQSSSRGTLIPIAALPRDGKVELPLSFAQQRLWFLDQLEPSLCAYNILKAIRLTGPLIVPALERAFNEIVKRHEVLRSTFHTVEGRPVLVISPDFTAALPVVDLTYIHEAEWEAEVQRRATEEGQRPFDLAQGPLLRKTLLRLSEHEHVLLLTVHHTVFDGWSFDILFRELTVFYEAFSMGRPAAVPELRIQYADFARWQGEWLDGEIREAQLSYWQSQQLEGSLPVLELPSDRPRPPVQTFQGAKQTLVLSQSVTEALKALSHHEGVTLFMTLLAAYKILLYRYTGQGDIIIGSLAAGRSRAEIEGLIGFFANTLVLRTELSGNPTFRELLSRVREVCRGAYAHQDLPFERLVEALQPARDMSHHPIFQVMFALQNIPRPSLKLAGLTMTPLEVHSGTAMFDLTLFMVERDQGLVGTFEYNTDLFDRATISRMMGHFQTLLEAIIADPEMRISNFPLLAGPERGQLLVDWNNTKADYPGDKCIHEWFESQVQRTPAHVAVVFENRRMTYSELDRRSNQLAQRLKSIGVGPEVLVGIHMEPSVEMVVGLFGILKAGGAYVPLDPTYPRERLAFMLEDAKVSVLLTQEQLLQALPKHQATTVCLDSGWETIDRESEEPASGGSAENLAYVIYTSGSTGKPKGVQIPHRAVVNFLESMRRIPGLTEEDRLLSVTSLSFDIAGLELYLPLMVGAMVILADKAVSSDPSRLLELVEQSQATVMQATPATWRMLLEAGWQGSERLKVLCGGEALSRELANQLRQKSVSLWNMYGPTETTIWSSVHPIESANGPVPIGAPIANTQFYILDSYLEPLPVGVPGELHIGGSGLARGYLNRPELTAEKFIAHPFSDKPGERLYKTGDLVRYRPNGTIEYLGRIDHQVKIRGFRVELGEIESVLRSHPAVREAVALTRAGAVGENLLVAYLVTNGEPGASVNELRNFLSKKLPDYMVPSAFVFLEALPLTPSGKVDRRALPLPDSVRPDLEAEYVAPRTDAERIIANIWEEVLRLPKVGMHDNFFDLGGHSLLMVQVHSKLRQAFEKKISMVEMFQHPTVASVAKHLSRQEDGQSAFDKIYLQAKKQKQAINRYRQLRSQ